MGLESTGVTPPAILIRKAVLQDKNLFSRDNCNYAGAQQRSTKDLISEVNCSFTQKQSYQLIIELQLPLTWTLLLLTAQQI